MLFLNNLKVETKMTTSTHSTFKIGAVSRITNIPIDTLRIWERRYSVVEPIRTNNSDRQYQNDDINRLTLLKMLVDRGHSIGGIAPLANEKLIERLEIHDQNTIRPHPKNTKKTVQVAVIGEVLSLQLEHFDMFDPSFSFTGLYRNEADFIERNEDDGIDVLILERPAIQGDQIQNISDLFKASGAKRLMLIYGFTNSAAMKLLKKTDYTYIQAPITMDHLKTEISNLIQEKNISNNDDSGFDLESKAPLRTYSNNDLIKLSSASNTIKCECPQHLSSMILKLIQFEIYSTECASRFKRDADLHVLLGNLTGHARSIMEQALKKVIETESKPMQHQL